MQSKIKEKKHQDGSEFLRLAKIYNRHYHDKGKRRRANCAVCEALTTIEGGQSDVDDLLIRRYENDFDTLVVF